MKNNTKMISFGAYVEGTNYKVLDERAVRASAGIMFLFGLVAIINGLFLENYTVIPYIVGFLLLNFLIGVFINPKFSPIMFLATWIVSKQEPLYVGAIQKRFAWSLGIAITAITFTLSLKLQSDPSIFPPICLLCLTCLALMFLETAFGICVGCKLYFLAIRLKLLKEPVEKPNCTGNSCSIK